MAEVVGPRLVTDRVLMVAPVGLDIHRASSQESEQKSFEQSTYRLVVAAGVRPPVLALVRRLVAPLVLLVETRVVPLAVVLPLEAAALDREEVLVEEVRIELRLVVEAVD